MKKITAFILALIMLLSLTACGSQPAPAANTAAPVQESQTPAESDTAVADEPIILNLQGSSLGYPNPFKHSSKGQGTIKMWELYDALLEKDDKGLVPWLATDYSVSDDGLTYTFTIREGVKWSDGEDLTPADVVFTYNYYRNFDPVVSNLVVDGEYIVTDAVDNGDGTVSVTVSEVLATNLETLAYIPIIPEHIWKDIDDPFNYSGDGDCVGSGPYLLKAIDEEKGEYQMVSNPLFWGKRFIDGINYIAVSDDVLAFDNGEIDYLNAPWDLYEKYANEPGCKASSNLPFLGYNLVFNHLANDNLADVNVRKAIAYAIDRQQIVDMVFNGHGTVASAGYLPEGHPMRNNNVTAYALDLEKATELMAGRSFSVNLKCGDSKEQIDVCELIKMYLAEIGIEVQVISCDSATLKDAKKNGDYDMVMNYGGGWGSDADSLHSMYAGWDPESGKALYSGAVLGYYNEELYELALQQQRTVDLTERTKLIYRMQEIIADEVPSLPILNVYDMLVTRPATYDGWIFRYDYNYSDGVKLSFCAAE